MGENIKRKDNWPTHLSKYLHENMGKSFAWGSNDCIMHAINACRAMTDYDIAKGYRGKYKSEKRAMEIIKSDFNGKMDNVFQNHLGAPRYDVGFVQRGDVIVTDIGGEEVYGVIDDSGFKMAIITKERGMVFFPKKVLRYWRING